MKIKELYEKIRDGVIISDIELQREIIYNTEKQQLVIDSILNDVPLPAFYLWKNDDEKLEVLNGLYNGEYLRGLTAYVSNDIDAIKVLSTNSRGKNQMKILKYLCILKNEKDLNEYVRKNQNISFADDQRTITKKNRRNLTLSKTPSLFMLATFVPYTPPFQYPSLLLPSSFIPHTSYLILPPSYFLIPNS